jgi:transcriptional regulator with GAF, ATPase, and Fis domain
MKAEKSKAKAFKDFLFPDHLPPREDMEMVLDFFFENYVKRGVNLKDFIEKLERHLLIKCLSEFDGNQKKTSEFLDMKPTTMNAKCKKYNIRFIKSVQ